MKDIRAENRRWMRRCLELAQKGAGNVSPNPQVGCVLVSADGEVLAEGYHAKFGGAHAEAEAISRALDSRSVRQLKNATLYVNLEPCSHQGKTPPCSSLIVRKGIPRVVVGMGDPFPAVAGSGITHLHEAGIQVTVGVLEEECKRLNEAYLHHLKTRQPLVTLKIAQTLDGCVATASGESRWITGKDARVKVHEWRAGSDGILIGSSTALADDPSLTIRHVDGPQPQRFVLDRRGLLPGHLQLFNDDFAARTCAIVGQDANPVYESDLEKKGGHVLRLSERDDHIDLAELLHVLGDQNATDRGPIQSLLVEAGPALATALLREDLVDRFYLFIAPKLIGGGTPSLSDLSVAKLADAITFHEHTWEQVGVDSLFRGYRRSL